MSAMRALSTRELGPSDGSSSASEARPTKAGDWPVAPTGCTGSTLGQDRSIEDEFFGGLDHLVPRAAHHRRGAVGAQSFSQSVERSEKKLRRRRDHQELVRRPPV